MKHTASDVKAFFGNSNATLDHIVLRPLSHIMTNWELRWDAEAEQYVHEDDSFVLLLNQMISDLANANPPARYHDNEDALAQYVIQDLNWKISKQGGRWIGADYEFILEQGGFRDVDQAELLTAAAGRIHAALNRGQLHFDDMEESHQRMLGAVLSVILYHRGIWTDF
jgi:hypothetical protein